MKVRWLTLLMAGMLLVSISALAKDGDDVGACSAEVFGRTPPFFFSSSQTSLALGAHR
jgi:hypothetical protein